MFASNGCWDLSSRIWQRLKDAIIQNNLIIKKLKAGSVSIIIYKSKCTCFRECYKNNNLIYFIILIFELSMGKL
jgi:hypothetical protein